MMKKVMVDTWEGVMKKVMLGVDWRFLLCSLDLTMRLEQLPDTGSPMSPMSTGSVRSSPLMYSLCSSPDLSGGEDEEGDVGSGDDDDEGDVGSGDVPDGGHLGDEDE